MMNLFETLMKAKNENPYKDITIYFDMDGVLAKWRDVPVEYTHMRKFYVSAEVDWQIDNLIKLLIAAGFTVKLLTKAYSAWIRREKRWWAKNIAMLKGVEIIFVPYEDNKSSYVSGRAILIDDYTDNLIEWVNSSPEHWAIKYYNGINGTKGRWTGPAIYSGQGQGSMFAAIVNTVGLLYNA